MAMKKFILLSLIVLLVAGGCAGRRPRIPRAPEPQAPPSGGAGQGGQQSAGDQPADYMDRYVIDQAAHPNAVCNDGSTPVFYFRRGVGEGADKWVIWFKGGGAAWSQETYKTRGPFVTSSMPWMTEAYARLGTTGNANSADGEADGILSYLPETNPDFYNWNHVYMVYCSSDSWTGNRPASPQTGGVHFQGANIAVAIFAALADPDIIPAPNLADAKQILVTGSSAGANGVRAHADRLALEWEYADVRAVADAGNFNFVTEQQIAASEKVQREQYEMWQPTLDQSCVQAHQADGEAWRCLSGGYLIENRFISTPLFLHQDQSDKKIVEALNDMGADPAADLPAISAGIRELLSDWEGVFSPNAIRHIIINEARFNRQMIDGYTMAQALGNWYFGRSGPVSLIEMP